MSSKMYMFFKCTSYCPCYQYLVHMNTSFNLIGEFLDGVALIIQDSSVAASSRSG